jgi:hypothetical protein
MNTRLACVGQLGSCLSLLGYQKKNQRKKQQVLASYHPVFGLPFIHHPLFAWGGPQNKEILLNLSMKSWDSAFNAQGSRVIIVVVQVRAVKIYVAAVYWRRWELSTGYYQMLLLMGDLISCSSILYGKSSVDLRWYYTHLLKETKSMSVSNEFFEGCVWMSMFWFDHDGSWIPMSLQHHLYCDPPLGLSDSTIATSTHVCLSHT